MERGRIPSPLDPLSFSLNHQPSVLKMSHGAKRERPKFKVPHTVCSRRRRAPIVVVEAPRIPPLLNAANAAIVVHCPLRLRQEAWKVCLKLCRADSFDILSF